MTVRALPCPRRDLHAAFPPGSGHRVPAAIAGQWVGWWVSCWSVPRPEPGEQAAVVGAGQASPLKTIT